MRTINLGLFKIMLGQEEKVPESNVSYDNSGSRDVSYGPAYPVINKRWDGEKTLGELGVIINNIPDYKRLRLRSYNAYATIDTVKIIASKFFYWTIGSGLKLQSEPNRTVLLSEGIKNDAKVYTAFQKLVEMRFAVYANSKMCDYKQEQNLHESALEAYQGTFLGGDMLCIVRYSDYGPTMQVVSGEHVCDPDLTSDYWNKAKKAGNYIENGIELNEKGSHVAYFVKTKGKDNLTYTYERIAAYGVKTKKRLAWMIYGKKLCSDHLRGVPEVSQSLEKINKLDRYTEAGVAKAEQAANISHFLEHKEYSTGESHLENIIAQKRGDVINTIDPEKNKQLADGIANKITQTTSGTAYNLPVGATIKSFDTQIETNFGEFHGSVFKQISASMDVPSEVAMQEYNSNYSASRAAINSFGYIIVINRNKFANDFYIPYYKLWLEYQILTNKVSAPGYIENRNNFMVTESYSQCRFTGKNMPHIDPLKEIKAVREMLGIDDKTPLISREQATEMLNAGQWDENFMKNLEEANIIPKEEKEETNPNSETDAE